LQKDYPDILIKFFKILKEIKLDYNVGIFITGIENLYGKEDMTKMDSFIYLLRTSSLYFPSFVKIIVSLQKGKKQDKILELLATKTVIDIKDKDIFESEGKSYLEFALNYASSSAAKLPPYQPSELLESSHTGLRSSSAMG